MAIISHQNIILNAHTAFPRPIKPGLDRKNHARLQNRIIAAHNLRRFMHIQPEPVSGFVPHILRKLGVFQHHLHRRKTSA